MTYPDNAVGDLVTADLLDSMLPRYYIKQSAESISADTTLSDDSELSSIPLEVGDFHIYLRFLWICNTSATPDIKTRWAFTGTWNNPVRASMGPSSTNTGSRDAVTPMKLAGINANADNIYGTPASTGFNTAIEEALLVTVTVAGNLSLQWAQNTSDASSTGVMASSGFIIRRTG